MKSARTPELGMENLQTKRRLATHWREYKDQSTRVMARVQGKMTLPSSIVLRSVGGLVLPHLIMQKICPARKHALPSSHYTTSVMVFISLTIFKTLEYGGSLKL